jgi:hypothetical protein
MKGLNRQEIYWYSVSVRTCGRVAYDIYSLSHRVSCRFFPLFLR